MNGITRKDWDVISATIEALENYPFLDKIEELTIVLKDTKCTGKIMKNDNQEWIFVQDSVKPSGLEFMHSGIPGARGTDLTI